MKAEHTDESIGKIVEVTLAERKVKKAKGKQKGKYRGREGKGRRNKEKSN